jgi:hypothetical protein
MRRVAASKVLYFATVHDVMVAAGWLVNNYIEISFQLQIVKPITEVSRVNFTLSAINNACHGMKPCNQVFNILLHSFASFSLSALLPHSK